jgi:beta-xylosidase
MMLPNVNVTPAAAVAPSAVPAVPAWQPVQADGTYRNPVLYADYSDPDATRVGDDFWMTSSSFGHVPGLPILHSRDLVNWTLVNYALPRLVPAEHFATPRHGGGVWAPSIRYHAGKYWIYYPDPDFGLYVTTAVDPRGAWSEPVLVLGGKGLIDPCPLWDDDGSVYLVHGWAKSRSGIANRVTLRRLSPDGLSTDDPGITVVEGADLPGWHTIEGPKLYRRGKYYYIFAPAGGVATGYQAVFRSENIRGPYEARIVLEQGRTAVNGPHQGAWVDTPSGESWFLHFQDRGAFGRIVHLQPMRWLDDGWPQMGTPGTSGIGEPVLSHAIPNMPRQPSAVPPTSDEFKGPKLGLQWQWQANPRPDWIEFSPNAGLRLHAVASPGASLWDVPNLLMQKFPAPAFVVTTKLEASALQVGEESGLVVFGYDYAWVGFRRSAAGLRLVFTNCQAAQEGGQPQDLADVAAPATTMVLRVAVSRQALCSFAYSTDGTHFTPVGPGFNATVSKWVGAKVGLFAQSTAPSQARGHADAAWFRVSAE